MMKVKYKGKTDVSFTEGKEYEVIAVENGWYRIVDDTDDDYLFDPAEPKGNIVLDVLSRFLYSVLPNWQYFWMADSVALGRIIPPVYLVYSLGYTLLYIVICSFWAMALFQVREIAKDAR